jgi:hypothetical protein
MGAVFDGNGFETLVLQWCWFGFGMIGYPSWRRSTGPLHVVVWTFSF